MHDTTTNDLKNSHVCSRCLPCGLQYLTTSEMKYALPLRYGVTDEGSLSLRQLIWAKGGSLENTLPCAVKVLDTLRFSFLRQCTAC